MPSLSKRVARVKSPPRSSASRSIRSISPISPSKLIVPPPLLSAVGSRLSATARHYRMRFFLDSRRTLRVQLVVQRLADFSPQHVHQVLRGGLLDAGDAAEALEEQASALLADPGHVVQRTVERALRAAAAMGGDRETVSLVANHLEELQRGI